LSPVGTRENNFIDHSFSRILAVEWGELFKMLMDRKVDHIFLRLILFIYSNQQCDVRRCGKFSARFTVSNGGRQGGVSSGIFFAVYIDKLLTILRESGMEYSSVP
jgi:hypothetical protein